VTLATSVLTPTLRYQPAVVGYVFAPLAGLNPQRVMLGIVSCGSMNATPAIGTEWPTFRERSDRFKASG
jgi:coenzyme F420-dependent glucose-6-phosphate dehydrogenase